MLNIMNLSNQRIVVFGFGAQGKAQTLNLKDSSKNISVYLRPDSPKTSLVNENNIPIFFDYKEACLNADIISMLIPDGEQPKVWQQIEPYLKDNTTVIFAHGFNIHYKLIKPKTNINIALVAPLAQGEAVRENFINGQGVPTLISLVESSDEVMQRVLDFAKGVAGKGPFIQTTFAEETETDLFAEQAILCGGLFELIRAGFDTLVESGYNPEIAYFCCLKEVKALANLVNQFGICGTREQISDVALFGDLTRGTRIINNNVRDEMKILIGEIRSGTFSDEFMSDKLNGNPLLRKLLDKDKNHPIENLHKRFSTAKNFVF